MGCSQILGLVFDILSKPYNLIVIFSIVVQIAAFLVIRKASIDKNYHKYNINSPIFLKAFEIRNGWLQTTLFWTLLDYFIVIISFECSLVVVFIAAYSPEITKTVLFYSILAIALLAFSFAINPKRHQKCYRKAYEIIDNPVNQMITYYN